MRCLSDPTTAAVERDDVLAFQFWQELVKYNSNYMEHYIKRIVKASERDIASLFRAEPVREQAKSFKEQCRNNIGPNRADYVAQRQDVLCLSYGLKQHTQADKHLTATQSQLKHNLSLLGSYYSALETFKAVAQNDATYKYVELTFVNYQYTLPSHPSNVQSIMDRLNTALRARVVKPQCTSNTRNGQCETACHAEMQLLHFREYALPSTESPDLYLGCSKKAF